MAHRASVHREAKPLGDLSAEVYPPIWAGEVEGLPLEGHHNLHDPRIRIDDARRFVNSSTANRTYEFSHAGIPWRVISAG